MPFDPKKPFKVIGSARKDTSTSKELPSLNELNASLKKEKKTGFIAPERDREYHSEKIGEKAEILSNRQKLYNNLLATKKVTQEDIGAFDTFNQFLDTPEGAKTLYANLIKNNIATKEQIGNETTFIEYLRKSKQPIDLTGFDEEVKKNDQPKPSIEKIHTESSAQDWFSENKPQIFLGAGVITIVLLFFFLYRIRHKWMSFFRNLNFKRLGIGAGVMLGVLAFTNPSLKQFDEFAPTSYNKRFVQNKKNVDTARLNNYLFFSLYVCIFEEGYPTHLRKKVYVAVCNNFFYFGHLEGDKLLKN